VRAKTHHTAVVAIPPEQTWEPIQRIRRAHDRNVDRWMPHVTLLYPFLAPEALAMAEGRLVQTCSRVARFDTSLAEFRFFDQGHAGATLWLVPEPGSAFVKLQAACQHAFPDCDDVSRYPDGFVPHLSVGQAPSASQARPLVAELQAAWRPFSFCLDAIAIIRREGTAPFRVERLIPLR
jgi:2'-5' RNA ligase